MVSVFVIPGMDGGRDLGGWVHEVYLADLDVRKYTSKLGDLGLGECWKVYSLVWVGVC